jgi:transcriptional regulator with XRE-family HTH domain
MLDSYQGTLYGFGMAATIGKRLLALIEKRGWTQRELARRTGLTPSAICQICLGDTEPSLDTIRKLARVLSVSEGRIINGTRAPQRRTTTIPRDAA